MDGVQFPVCFPGSGASADLWDGLKRDGRLVGVPSDCWAARVCWQSVETSLRALGYLSPFAFVSRKMMRLKAGGEGRELVSSRLSPQVLVCMWAIYVIFFPLLPA